VSRNGVAIGAVIMVGGLLWLVMAWHAPTDDGELPVAAAPAPATRVEPVLPPTAAPAPERAWVSDPAATYEDEPAEPEAAEPAAEAPAPPRALAEQITGDQGPVEEYRKQYSLETRASDSAEVEAKLRAAFYDRKAQTDLIKSVSCRKEICRIEMRWSMERMRSYVGGLTRIGPGFVRRYALSPMSEADADGVRLVEVYMKRKSGTDPIKPLHAH
jgi:hypothetical protein